MNNNIPQFQKHVYKVAVTLIVLLSLIFILNEINNYYELLELPITFRPTYLIYGLIIQILFLLITSYAWKYNMFLCAEKKISLISCFSQVSLVFIGKYIPGKIWGMYARSINLRSHNISYSESLLGTYIEQLISVHSGLAFGLISLLIAIKSKLLIPAILFVLLSIYLAPLLQNYIFRIISNYRRKRNNDNVEVQWFELDRYSYLNLFILYLLEWVLMGVILVILYFALFNTSRSVDLIFLLMGSSAIAFVIGFFAIFAPGGIGIREGVIVSLISQHIPIADSLVLVIAFRLWCTCSDIIVGILGLLLTNNMNIENSK